MEAGLRAKNYYARQQSHQESDTIFLNMYCNSYAGSSCLLALLLLCGPVGLAQEQESGEEEQLETIRIPEKYAREQEIDVEVTRYGIDDLDRAIADSEAHRKSTRRRTIRKTNSKTWFSMRKPAITA